MADYMWGDQPTQFFFDLHPDIILNAIDDLGFRSTGRCLTLNSMENRVFEVEIEVDESKITSPSDKFVIAKFYRPGRWTKEQIQEEHDFLWDLKEQEIPVIAPLKINGTTLFTNKQTGLFFTLFPKQGGRNLDEMNEENLMQMGRLLARLHTIGAAKEATHRLKLNPLTYGELNIKFLRDQKIIPAHLEEFYFENTTKICKLTTKLFEGIKVQRVHGDCHLGNILFKEQQAFLIDFDDMVVAPKVQDIWLVVPGIDQEARINREILLEGYESMNSFDRAELKLIEPLRALRYIHFSAWIAKRWDDPAFKKAFPHFDSEQYWQTQLQDLKNQLELIENSLI